MPKLITTIFAANGDLAYPPASSSEGSVNLDQGYTPQYEIDLASGDPTAKAVERNIMNGMFNWLFDNQLFEQSHGIAPWFSTFTGGYPINALIADNTTGTWQIYRSLIDANSSVPTLATAWERVLTQTEILNRIPFAIGGATGSATGELASATNLNSVTYSQGVWLVTTDAIAASLVNAPSARQGVLICRNTNKNYNPTLANVGSFFQMYIDADGKQYIRSYAIPSGGSTAVWTAWKTTASLESPVFTGTPAATTAAVGTSTTQLATTAFVANSFAPIASPVFTGDPKAPTPSSGDNDTSIATTAFVQNALLTFPGRLLKFTRYTASGTHPISSGTKHIRVRAQAGGGGGGGCAGTLSGQVATSGGGCGGFYGETSLIDVSGLTSIDFIIGLGGNGGAAGATSGSAGGDTSFGSYIKVPGGFGGSPGTAIGAARLYADNGGIGSVTGSAVIISIAGGMGRGGIAMGVTSEVVQGGKGGDGVWGRGGQVSTGGSAPGGTLGSGGGGAGVAVGPATAGGGVGGRGGDGSLIVEEYS